MTTPSPDAFNDPKTLQRVAKIAGLSVEKIIKNLKNPNLDLINDPENPYQKLKKGKK